MKTNVTHLPGQIYHQTNLTLQQLADLLRQIFPQGAYWLGTSPENADLKHAATADALAILPDTWPAGRAFSSIAEVRWEQQAPASFAVWLLAENLAEVVQNKLAQFAMAPLATTWTVNAAVAPIYLWGQYRPELAALHENPWVEVRVPRLLDYPVDRNLCRKDAFVGIGYLHYSAPNGAVQFTRLTALQIINPKQS